MSRLRNAGGGAGAPVSSRARSFLTRRLVTLRLPLSGHIDPGSGEQCRYFAQTCSILGLNNAAIPLSLRRDQAF